jgi:hypothetical protein
MILMESPPGRVNAQQALRMGLVDAIADDPVAEALRRNFARWSGERLDRYRIQPALRGPARVVYRNQSAPWFLDPWLTVTNPPL